MVKNLVIVESPAKSKTIKKYLGKDFEVKASMGHVVDLPKKDMGIDMKKNFTPKYEVSPDKKKVVAGLKKIAKTCDTVWIATDEDREGEAIGWHVANQLKLDITKTPRIVFHEITEKAIKAAVKNPRTIDMKLVDAQQARRVLDRLVGFELSPVLRRKVKTGLSAGRVQSVAVRLIVEREREINAFQSNNFFKTLGFFQNTGGEGFRAELNKSFPNREDVVEFLEECKASDFIVSNVEQKPGKKSSSAPFTTSTLQQEASRKLGLPVARTMQIAQRLYEGGHITYMRTDSLNLSKDAVVAAEQEIKSKFGVEYSKPTYYKSKAKGAQEAHECIRPTNLSNSEAGADAYQKKLYNLIWKRTLASQMADAEIERTVAKIDITKSKNKFVAKGEVIKFDGFLKLYIESVDDDSQTEQEGMLPKLIEGEKLDMQEIIATETQKKHPPRYTEASLVKKLEEQGIGRPSTYAPTISTIQKRGYVLKETRQGNKVDILQLVLKSGKISDQTKQQTIGTEKNKLFPTDIGLVVTDFLMEKFDNIMDYNFTASVEEQFDVIAEGNLVWNDMIKEFYSPFHKKVEAALGEKLKSTGERLIGKDPKTGKDLIARIGRYGPMLQIGGPDDEEKPKYAGIPKNKSMETLTLEEALELFNLPREVGEYQGEKVLSNNGRFGPYIKVKYDKKDIFVSIPKDAEFDIFSVTMEEATPLIEAKIELNKNKYISEFEHDKLKIEVLNGPYGPYIKYNKKNYKIPKGGKDATDLTKNDCIEIIGGSKK